MNDRPAPDVLVLCKDLMFSSHLNGAVQRAGLQPQTCLGEKTVLTNLEQFDIQWVIIDLELKPLDLQKIREATTSKLIGFGPHVHEQLLSSAHEAGLDYVLSRGQIFSGLEDLLSQD